ncbi:MAG: hypothetical protein GC147_14250 [Porphyrobacter sp.]|nr:hypothetical protein [Porphyrobacter sp.]
MPAPVFEQALNGLQGRKADRPPRLMARKPRRTDVRRPALEGENKKAPRMTSAERFFFSGEALPENQEGRASA